MIDCHFHLDETIVGADGLVASMDVHGVSRAAVIAPLCPDIQKRLVLTLAGPLLRRALVSGSATLKAAVVRFYGSLVKAGGQVDVGGRRYPVIQQPDNESVARAVAARPDRLWGWIFVNPAGPADPALTISRYAREPGMVGVKAHPFWHAYPTDMLRDAAETCRHLGLPMLVHLGVGPHGDFAMLASSFPEVPLVFAHAGVPFPDEVCALAGKKDNVYVDLSAASYVDRRIAVRALSLAGPEKCLWGSDGPYFHHRKGRYDYTERLFLLDSLNLSPADRERVAGGNFLSILGSRGA